MKNLENFFINCLILCSAILFYAFLFVWDLPKPRYYVEDVKEEAMIYEDDEIDWNHVTVTVYNPVPEQCDSDPLVTADNSVIDTLKLKKDKLRWVAVSRDFIKGGILAYGDKVKINCEEDPSLSGVYTVHDTMHPRFSRCIDILKHQSVRTLGKYRGVEVEFLRD